MGFHRKVRRSTVPLIAVSLTASFAVGGIFLFTISSATAGPGGRHMGSHSNTGSTSGGGTASMSQQKLVARANQECIDHPNRAAWLADRYHNSNFHSPNNPNASHLVSDFRSNGLDRPQMGMVDPKTDQTIGVVYVQRGGFTGLPAAAQPHSHHAGREMMHVFCSNDPSVAFSINGGEYRKRLKNGGKPLGPGDMASDPGPLDANKSALSGEPGMSDAGMIPVPEASSGSDGGTFPDPSIFGNPGFADSSSVPFAQHSSSAGQDGSSAQSSAPGVVQGKDGADGAAIANGLSMNGAGLSMNGAMPMSGLDLSWLGTLLQWLLSWLGLGGLPVQPSGVSTTGM